MDCDHEAYPDEMTVDEYVDSLTARERQGNLLYEQEMKERADDYERREEERRSEEEKHQTWAKNARAERIATQQRAMEDARRKREAQIVSVGKVAAKTAAFGVGALLGLCSVAIQGFKKQS